ncbi:MAG: hypothetical protein MHPSP_001075 [Paramarteilia canceri]
MSDYDESKSYLETNRLERILSQTKIIRANLKKLDFYQKNNLPTEDAIKTIAKNIESPIKFLLKLKHETKNSDYYNEKNDIKNKISEIKKNNEVEELPDLIRKYFGDILDDDWEITVESLKKVAIYKFNARSCKFKCVDDINCKDCCLPCPPRQFCYAWADVDYIYAGDLKKYLDRYKDSPSYKEKFLPVPTKERTFFLYNLLESMINLIATNILIVFFFFFEKIEYRPGLKIPVQLILLALAFPLKSVGDLILLHFTRPKLDDHVEITSTGDDNLAIGKDDKLE